MNTQTLQLQYRPVDVLIPYCRNARTHSEAQVAQIAASIVEFGWTNPVLVDGDNGVVAGHGRLLAARKLGLANVPVIELAHLSPTQKRAYILADNRIAENAGWDADLLRLELEELQATDFDLALTGFDADELLDIMAGEETTTEGNTDEDAAPRCQSRRCPSRVMSGSWASTGCCVAIRPMPRATTRCSATSG